MTRSELLATLSEPFYADFADRIARWVREEDAVGVLYTVATAPNEDLPKNLRHKVLFRGAYVLEKIYFDTPECFAPYLSDFCERTFAACTDPSAKRHFAKIMADVLAHYTPEEAVLTRIAETAAAWAVAPDAKVAVRCGAVDVLRHCRELIAWVEQMWNDLVACLSHDATPGIAARLRNL